MSLWDTQWTGADEEAEISQDKKPAWVRRRRGKGSSEARRDVFSRIILIWAVLRRRVHTIEAEGDKLQPERRRSVLS